jgi:hypothetical protein
MALPYSFASLSHNNLWNATYREGMHRCNGPHWGTNKFIKNTKKAENEGSGLYNAHASTCRTDLVI